MSFLKDLQQEFDGYNGKKLSKDIMAGITVAAVALPLALAFGVSSGADAAAGLVTAVLAGLLIGSLSGASYQISGPTGAMSAILMSLSMQFGMRGVLIAGFISGAILLLAALCKLGRLVTFIPSPVITGFTSGIAIIIAFGQIDNLFGTVSQGENLLQKLLSYGKLGFAPDIATLLFGVLVMAIMIFWPKKWNAVVPSSLVGITAALVLNILLHPAVAEVGTIPKSLFTKDALLFAELDFSNIRALLTPAVSIAALGMIESLLCGASAGKMKGERLNADRELLAQGIGNMLIPLFGGVPATAAIARTSVAIKSGGQTRLVSVFHSLTILLSMFLLGGVMSRIPLSALAGVLIVTAWRMNDFGAMRDMFGKKFKSSISQFLVTMAATVIFDLTIAIVIGVVLAMLLYVVRSSALTVTVRDVDPQRLPYAGGNYSKTRLVYVTGSLFFATSNQLMSELRALNGARTVILSMRGVPHIDHSSVNDLCEVYDEFAATGKRLLFCAVQPQVKEMMDRAGITKKAGETAFYWDAVAAIQNS